MKLSNKILIWFSVITIAVAAISIIISNAFYKTKEDALEISDSINNIHFKFLKLKNITNDFFAFETIDTVFYITGESNFLEKGHLQNANLTYSLKTLREQHNELENFVSSIVAIEQVLRERDSIFSTLSVYASERGFKDYGMIGEMRSYAHRLEQSENINKEKLLSLRRREKDFLLRHEEKYITAFLKHSRSLTQDLHTKSKFNKEALADVANLKAYKTMFLKVANIDGKMGLFDNSGLKGNLSDVDKLVEKRISKALAVAERNLDRNLSRVEKSFILTVAFTLLICFFLANILSHQVTKPVSRLVRCIEGIMLNEFKTIPKFVKTNKTHEIKILYREFSHMLDQLRENQEEKDVLIKHLTAGEKKYRDMADSLPQGLFETDKNGCIVYVNKVWEEYFGYNKSEAEFNLNIFEITQSKNVKSKDYRKNEVVANRKDKTWFPALLYMDEVAVGDNVKGWRGVIIDISERYNYINLLKKEQRKALESEKLKSAFLANVSHEIRTPINAIMGFSTLLKDAEEDAVEREIYHDIIEKSSKDLLSVFEDMIAVSRLESDEAVLYKEEINLKSLESGLLSIVEQQSVEMKKEHLNISYINESEDDINVVNIDKEKVVDVIRRLCHNALKYTLEGEVTLGHRMLKNRVIFFVRDTGIGIPKDKQAIVFDPFRQVDESNTKVNGGIGLGLAICQGIIKQMEGTIWLDSAEGEGTGFYFSIPIECPMAHKTDLPSIEPEKTRAIKSISLETC